LPKVPRWASEAAGRQARVNRTELLTALGPAWSGQLAAEVGAVTGVTGPHLPWAATEIEMITHNAHAPGHTALWVSAARVLVAGDMLSDVELPLLEESSLADYLQGLDALWPLVSAAAVVIPGHGRPATNRQGVARWTADRRYLDALAAGADPVDPRRNLPGMEQAHRANVERGAAIL
jgi:glyoxylase-like metal-dependent hydrolase (beta-lactamase superfamily II)